MKACLGRKAVLGVVVSLGICSGSTGLGAAWSQVAPVKPAVPTLPGFCANGALIHDVPVPPACPAAGSTTRIWSVQCNPLCYTTTHSHDHTATGYCLDIAEEVPYTPPIWVHCGYVPPSQLVTFGNAFRTKGANGWGYMVAPAMAYSCTKTYWIRSSYCTNCDVDVWECLNDPVIVSTLDDRYELTDTSNGVRFDLDADGETERIPWIAGEDDAFLVLDRNGNGVIDDGRELFSHVSPQERSGSPNGLLALRMFDRPSNGGNGDGRISSGDRVFDRLRLWLDVDRDGSTDDAELVTLASAGLVEMELEYTDALAHEDEHGNTFRYSARVRFAGGRSVLAWVVYFNIEECSAEE